MRSRPRPRPPRAAGLSHARPFPARCLFAALLALSACGRDPAPPAVATDASPAAKPAAAHAFYASRFEKRPGVPALTALGRTMFFDPSLSASGRMSCASCHDPARAYGPPDGRAVQLGGADLRQPGVRAVPSLRYVQNVPAFAEHYFEDDGNDSEDQGPTGGHDWDGRADSAHEQARTPLLSPFEMANATPAAVVARLRAAPYAAQLREAFGAHVLDDETLAFDAALLALETFQQSPADFYPYDSKYDAYLRRQVALTPQERRGLALFDDPGKGNCASCHPSGRRGGAFPAFSDFGMIALGVPRNRDVPANRDPGYFDLGLCGPLRTDFAARGEYCGLFRTPSLRNVATRRVFFHNGAFHSLREVLRFYATRDTQPSRWYPRDAQGHVAKFDDLPPRFRANVNLDPPFGRRPGAAPALTEAEIDDLLAFLGTLTDGYGAPASAAGERR